MREGRSFSGKVFKGLCYILVFFLCVNGAVTGSIFCGKKNTAVAEVEAKDSVIKFEDSIYKGEIYASKSGRYIYYSKVITGEYDLDNRCFYKYDISTGKSKQLINLGYFSSFSSNTYYYIDDKLYYAAHEDNYLGTYNVYCLDLITEETTKLFEIEKRPEDVSVDSLFADENGNIYLIDKYTRKDYPTDENGNKKSYYYVITEGYKIVKHDSAGTKIFTSDMIKNGINNTIRFDPQTGLIFFEGTYNWVYWGYDHEMNCFNVARLSNNGKITYPSGDNYITILYQEYFFEHYSPVECLGNKYFAVLSTFSSDTLFILDAKKIKPEDVKESETSISLVDSGVSVSGVNLGDQSALLFAVGSSPSKYEDNIDISSVGARCALFNENGTDVIYVKTDEKRIDKYPVDQKTSTGYIEAKYPVYKVLNVAGKLTLIEKDGNTFYVEEMDTSVPDKITIDGQSNLTVGECMSCNVSFNTQMIIPYTYSSSDSSVASVDSEGNVAAWKPGTATIYAKSVDGRLSSELTVSVSARSIGRICSDSTIVAGTVSNNLNDNDYRTYSKEICSYLVQTGASSFMRVEKNGKNTFLVEYFDSSGNVTSSQTLNGELIGFAGFYAGKDNYFVVYGQDNEEESDNTEVLRIVKYDKNWNRIGSCSIFGANTSSPIASGSLRMTEYNGSLYIHTCHRMYKSDDGYNHQANMSFVIDEASMKCTDSYSGVMNLSEGYASHSFNQFIAVQDGWIYRSDHGDAYPRGISVTGFPAEGKLGAPKIYGIVLQVDGIPGDNYTGISLGGFEVSNTSYLMGYNQDAGSAYDERNTKIVATNRKSGKSIEKNFTNYSAGSGITCKTPVLVKLNDHQFMMMWVEENLSDNSSCTAFQLLNSEGDPVGGVVRNGYKLSDCPPIVLSDGTVAWYVSDGTNVTLYNVDPFNIPSSAEKWIDSGDGETTYYNPEGWEKDKDDNWRYSDGQGGYASGWKEIDGSWYYFDSNGNVAKNEYRDGYWLGPDGKMNSNYSGKWKGNSTGWWFEDESGWYPISQWLKINGNWYYFGADGYMVSGEYREGCWIDYDGVMNPNYTHGVWKSNSTGWWFEDNGWYPSSQWLKINGYYYYFGADGYMCTDEWRDGYYLDPSGALLYQYTGSWHYSGGWWFGDESGWYAHDAWVKINGDWYWFDSSGYIS